MKREIRKLVRRFGYDIIKFQKNQMGIYPFYDMKKFVKSKDPIFFDIGANVGQTVKDFNEVFKNATIHAFEPSPNTFEILKNNTSNVNKLHLWNYGVGSSVEDLLLNEYALSNLNSFFDIHNYENCKLKGKTLVKTITVDQFVTENGIQMIDILKIDTEGYELEVFKGAINTIKELKIGLLYFEASFVERQKEMPSFTELWDFAIKHEFELVSIYPLVHRKNMGVYTNILFKHKSY